MILNFLSALEKLKAANQDLPITPIVWTSEMTAEGRRFLNPADYVIHIWSESWFSLKMPNLLD